MLGFTKKICKRNWKETDSLCTTRQLSLFNHRQRHAPIDQGKILFWLCVHPSNVCPCVMADFQVSLYCSSCVCVLPVPIIPQCTVHWRQLLFHPSGEYLWYFMLGMILNNLFELCWQSITLMTTRVSSIGSSDQDDFLWWVSLCITFIYICVCVWVVYILPKLVCLMAFQLFMDYLMHF